MVQIDSMVWDYTKKAYKEQADKDIIWALERQINYGEGPKKLDRKLLKKYLSKLKIPENRRNFLKLIVWNKKKF